MKILYSTSFAPHGKTDIPGLSARRFSFIAATSSIYNRSTTVYNRSTSPFITALPPFITASPRL
nr:MAG TPA: hypothetical protein [Caudoviricetes sp.]